MSQEKLKSGQSEKTVEDFLKKHPEFENAQSYIRHNWISGQVTRLLNGLASGKKVEIQPYEGNKPELYHGMSENFQSVEENETDIRRINDLVEKINNMVRQLPEDDKQTGWGMGAAEVVLVAKELAEGIYGRTAGSHYQQWQHMFNDFKLMHQQLKQHEK